MGFRNAVYPFSVFLFNFFPPMCVCDFLCVYDEKKIIFRILLLVLWIYTPSFLTWNEEGCTTPCYFFFHFWCHTRFSFSFLLSLLLFDPQGPCIFGFFSVVFFFWNAIAVCFFLDEDSLPVRSVEPPPCMFIFFLSLGDAKNWQQKERKKNGFIERAGTVTWLVAFFPPP